ncbi:9993_t:CDS:1 [Scutellospora calospora]|uniref:9993_t:CDS:1 n=1 Tax=Scutellospora calospora TaxID=85575 RepID=A0ACA9JU25_9GLOM|nr:9993_t:CDS:1 [Scutellospora calospora]
MVNLNEYNLDKYNNLQIPDAANNELKKKDSEFNEFLDRFIALTREYGIELGVRLLHSHNIPLKDGQAMVEKFVDNYKGKPALITSADSPSDSCPASWILNGDNYLVFEYSNDPAVMRIYEKLAKDSTALDKVSALIKEYNLDNLIGPCITARDTMNKFNMSQRQALVESTINIEDKYVNIIQSRSNEESSSVGIKTLWGAKLNETCMTNLPCYCCINDQHYCQKGIH